MHFDTVTASGSGGTLAISNISVSAVGYSGESCSFDVYPGTAGTYRVYNNASYTTSDWITPTSAAPGAPAYQFRVNLTTDGSGPYATVYGPTGGFGTWIDISATHVTTQLEATAPYGGASIYASANGTIDVRQGTGPVLKTVTWYLECYNTP